VLAFFAGGMMGAIMAVHAGGQLSLLIPTLILVVGGVWSRRADGWNLSLRRSTGGAE